MKSALEEKKRLIVQAINNIVGTNIILSGELIVLNMWLFKVKHNSITV
jgi:hypothetical protein